jgi:hypothetical protein
MSKANLMHKPVVGKVVPTGRQSLNCVPWDEHDQIRDKRSLPNRKHLAEIPQSDADKSMPASVFAMSMADKASGAPRVFTNVACVALNGTHMTEKDVDREFIQKTNLVGMIPAPVEFRRGHVIQDTIAATGGIDTVKNTHPTLSLEKDAWIMVRPPRVLVRELLGLGGDNARADRNGLELSNPHNAPETYSFNPLSADRAQYDALLDMKEILQIDSLLEQLCYGFAELYHWSQQPNADATEHQADVKQSAQDMVERIRANLANADPDNPHISTPPAEIAYRLLAPAAALTNQVLRMKVGKALSTIRPGQYGAAMLDTTRPGDLLKLLASYKRSRSAGTSNPASKKRPAATETSARSSKRSHTVSAPKEGTVPRRARKGERRTPFTGEDFDDTRGGWEDKENHDENFGAGGEEY